MDENAKKRIFFLHRKALEVVSLLWLRRRFGYRKAYWKSSLRDYRYGFNGKENDKDFGNDQLIQDYGFRLYNPSIGKFLSVDPLSPQFPELTPYQFASNTPIWAIDLDGLEAHRTTEDIIDQWMEGIALGVNDRDNEIATQIVINESSRVLRNVTIATVYIGFPHQIN